MSDLAPTLMFSIAVVGFTTIILKCIFGDGECRECKKRERFFKNLYDSFVKIHGEDYGKDIKLGLGRRRRVRFSQ